MSERRARPRLTWLAIVDGRTGYAIDAYPKELASYRRRFGSTVIGEFADREKARTRVWGVTRERAGGRST